jgi:Holliday junction resolvase RusA-like endonuclease
VITEMSKRAKPWKAEVAAAALDAYQGPLLEGPLHFKVVEYRLRPKSHFGKSGLNKRGREHTHPISAPDCLKIARAIEDALSGVIYRDDSQIVSEVIKKRWGQREHTRVYIWEVSNGRYGYSTLPRWEVGEDAGHASSKGGAVRPDENE